jgi:(R,R)-butanediol dehydrogenase / meso-butanediol dehydrogenase / diacetyl reductase
MKAAVFHGAGDVRVEEVAPPGLPGPGQVLIRTRLCGICGTDLHEYRHGPNIPTVDPHPLTGATLPQILGHEFSAEVLATGDGVTSVRVSDRVAIMPLFFCGRCGPCLSGRPQVCDRLGAVGYNWPWGGMGELAIVAEHQVAALPENVSDLQGALVEPAAVAVHAVATARITPGDVILITGGGPIGQLVALAAAAAGAGEILVAETSSARRTRLEQIGVSVAIDPAHTDLVELVHERFPTGVDSAIECAGTEPTLNACIASVKRCGTVVQTALHPAPARIDPRQLTLRDVSLVGCNCFPVTSWPRVIRLIATGKLPVHRIVTGEIDLEDVVDRGFRELLAPGGEHTKILVRTA